jgi:hypothetical protein
VQRSPVYFFAVTLPSKINNRERVFLTENQITFGVGNVASYNALVYEICDDAFDFVIVDGDVQPFEGSYDVINCYQGLPIDHMHSLE